MKYHPFITHASIAAGVGRAFSRVCLFVRALTGAQNGLSNQHQLGTRILYSSCSACIDPAVKR